MKQPGRFRFQRRPRRLGRQLGHAVEAERLDGDLAQPAGTHHGSEWGGDRSRLPRCGHHGDAIDVDQMGQQGGRRLVQTVDFLSQKYNRGVLGPPALAIQRGGDQAGQRYFAGQHGHQVGAGTKGHPRRGRSALDHLGLCSLAGEPVQHGAGQVGLAGSGRPGEQHRSPADVHQLLQEVQDVVLADGTSRGGGGRQPSDRPLAPGKLLVY